MVMLSLVHPKLKYLQCLFQCFGQIWLYSFKETVSYINNKLMQHYYTIWHFEELPLTFAVIFFFHFLFLSFFFLETFSWDEMPHYSFNKCWMNDMWMTVQELKTWLRCYSCCQGDKMCTWIMVMEDIKC